MDMKTRRDLGRLLLGSGFLGTPWAAQAAGVGTAATVRRDRDAQAQGRPSDVRPRIGFALGAGSARGFAHIGVLKALDQAGIKPDVVVGCSAGALIGAFVAGGFTPWQIEAVALRARDADFADFTTGNRRGLLVGDLLARFVNDSLNNARIENMPLIYAAVATDLRTGELVMLRNGPVGDAVRASCSIPGVFIPRELNGRELVDGGLVAPLPVRTARSLGCDVVIAVDVGARPFKAHLPGMYEVLLQSFEIMSRTLAETEAIGADGLIRVDTSAYSGTDFTVRREMIQAGYEAAQRALPELRKRLAQPATTRRG
jgi:NTE family protein